MSQRIEKTLLGTSVIVVCRCPRCTEELESRQLNVGQTEKCPVCGGEFVVPGPIAVSEKGWRKSVFARTAIILVTGVFLPLLSLAALCGWMRLTDLCKYFLAVVGVGAYFYASKQLRIVKYTKSKHCRSLYLKLGTTWVAIFVGFLVINYVDPASPSWYPVQDHEDDLPTQLSDDDLLSEREVYKHFPRIFARSNYRLGLESVELEGDFVSAVRYFTKAIEVRPDYAEAYVARGCATLQGFNGHESAIADHTVALSLQPGLAPAYFHRAHTFWRAGRDYEALEDCDRAISLDPHFAQAFWLRSQVLKALEEYDRAKADLDRANQLGATNAPWYPWQAKPWQPAAHSFAQELAQHSMPSRSFADTSVKQSIVRNDVQSLTAGMIVGRTDDNNVYDIAFPGDMFPNAEAITIAGKSAQMIVSIRIAENQPILVLRLLHISLGKPLGVQEVTVTSGSESVTHHFSTSMVMRQSVPGRTIELATMLPDSEASARRFLNVIRNSQTCNVQVKGAGGLTTFSPSSTGLDHTAKMLSLHSEMKQRPEFVANIQQNAISATQFQKAVMQAFQADASPLNNLDQLKTDLNRQLGPERFTEVSAFVEYERGVEFARRADQHNIKSSNRLWESAIESLNKAIELEPRFVAPRIVLACIHLHYKNEHDKAKQLLDEAIRREPANAEAHYYLADVYLDGGNEEEAMREVNLAVNLDPYFAPGYRMRSQLYEARNELTEAANDYMAFQALRGDFDADYVYPWTLRSVLFRSKESGLTLQYSSTWYPFQSKAESSELRLIRHDRARSIVFSLHHLDYLGELLQSGIKREEMVAEFFKGMLDEADPTLGDPEIVQLGTGQSVLDDHLVDWLDYEIKSPQVLARRARIFVLANAGRVWSIRFSTPRDEVLFRQYLPSAESMIRSISFH